MISALESSASNLSEMSSRSRGGSSRTNSISLPTLVTKEAILGPGRRFNEAQLLAGAVEAIELPVARR